MKNTLLLMIVVAYLLIPTGTPDDVITFFIINLVGAKVYSILLGIVLIAMWHYRINFEKIKEAGKIIRKKYLKKII